MPARMVDHQAGKRGAHGRREGDDQGEDAHRATTLVRGEGEHEHSHHERHDDTGTGRLDHAARKQDAEAGAPSGNQAARREDTERTHVERTGGEALDQEGGDGDHDGVDHGESGGEPLHRGGADLHLLHDGRHRRRHERLVEHGDERAEDQHTYHFDLFSCEPHGQPPIRLYELMRFLFPVCVK